MIRRFADRVMRVEPVLEGLDDIEAFDAAREVMSRNPAAPDEVAYLAVFSLLAAAALWPEPPPAPPRQGLLRGF